MRFTRTKGYKYRTDEAVLIQTGIKGISIKTKFLDLDRNGFLLIRPYYAWDGASGPTWDDDTNYFGTLVHDAFYQLFREGLLDREVWRKYVDQLLRKICIANGMWRIRAHTWYWFVRRFGKKYSYPEDKPRNTVYEAPSKLSG